MESLLPARKGGHLCQPSLLALVYNVKLLTIQISARGSPWINMKRWMILMPSILGLTLLLQSGCVVRGGVVVPAPPVPVVEFGEPAPFVGAVWVGGRWVWHPEHARYEWHHGYWRR